jgi:hypothetical protein
MDSAYVARSGNVETQTPLHGNPGIVDIGRLGIYYVQQHLSFPDDDSERAWPLLSTSKSHSTPRTKLKIREYERRSITQRLTRWVSKLVTVQRNSGLTASGTTSGNLTSSSLVRM